MGRRAIAQKHPPASPIGDGPKQVRVGDLNGDIAERHEKRQILGEEQDRRQQPIILAGPLPIGAVEMDNSATRATNVHVRRSWPRWFFVSSKKSVGEMPTKAAKVWMTALTACVRSGTPARREQPLSLPPPPCSRSNGQADMLAPRTLRQLATLGCRGCFARDGRLSHRHGALHSLRRCVACLLRRRQCADPIRRRQRTARGELF